MNAVHSGGQTLAAPPTTRASTSFPSPRSLPAALGLNVAITDPNMVAAANAANGTLDGSDCRPDLPIARGHDAAPTPRGATLWSTWASPAQAATRRASVSETSRAVAENLQRSNASVDVDEEMTNMLSYQRAYEGAARVLTAIDQMLDTLINRTGLVGR